MKKILFISCLLALCSCTKKQEPEKNPNLSITQVTIDGNKTIFTKVDSTFLVTFPDKADFSKCYAEFTFIGDKITCDGKDIAASSTLDLSKPLKISVWDRNYHNDYTVIVRNTGLPIVYINTPNKKAITSKEVWMEGADIKIVNADGSEDYAGSMSIRGRGNSTWGYPKKPYAIKLDSKSKILGMPKHKRWVLLANWKDRTLLRNDAAFWLSRHSPGLAYTVRGEFVELVLNGKHQGNYYLCEQIKIDENRVNVGNGFLIELDTYFDEVQKFWSKEFHLPYMIKEPDPEEVSDEAFAGLQEYVNNLEAILKDSERLSKHEYEQFYDVDSSIDVMFIQELACNTDFYSTWPEPGPHSYYLYKPVDDKIYSGPVWDFDYHGFVPDFGHQWAGANKFYFNALWKDEKYKNRMLEKWEAQKATYLKLQEYIDEKAEYIRLSEEFNHKLWPINNNENGDENMSFQQSIDRIKEGLRKKHSWMDSNLKNL